MLDWIKHADSSDVLWGQTIVYTLYCVVILMLIAWFAVRLTDTKSRFDFSPKVFYTWVGGLAVLAVGLHLITLTTIPWEEYDLFGGPAEKIYNITIGDHQWKSVTVDGATTALSATDNSNTPILPPCGKLVRFSVTSEDLTYGFGIFRGDNSMVAQMQVVPGHKNDLTWKFNHNGVYYIRSTEYSGPAGHTIVAPGAIVVSDCKTGGQS
ncbi:MAG: hypothetical protein FWD64_10125 [Acidobacteriaceae bacterium]|nr:hypothetical protein [Acidobacteriaceae bacterium]